LTETKDLYYPNLDESREGANKMAVVTITKDNFEAEVLACKIPVVLDFWAEWCEPCKMQSPVIEELAAELDGKVKFCKVNVDEEASLALNYQIMSIPTLVVMHYGLFQGKAVGVQGKDAIREMLKKIE
jgi:thioredoxin 1